MLGPHKYRRLQAPRFRYGITLIPMCPCPTRFRVNQVPSLQDLLFVKFPNPTSPITVQRPLGKPDHAPYNGRTRQLSHNDHPSLVRLTQPI